MIKQTLIVTFLICITSCTQKPKTSEFSDDYVLIEFAARLEEDYHRFHPEPLEKSTKSTSE